MSRMKKKWLGGGISLALVAVLSLLVVTPVWAGDVTPSSDVEDGDITDDNNTDDLDDLDPYEFESNTSSPATDIEITNHSSYTVSVPKAIKLYNINTVEADNAVPYTSGKEPYVYVKDADIPAGREMQIKIDGDVELTDDLGFQQKGRKLKATFDTPSKGSLKTNGPKIWFVNAYTDNFRVKNHTLSTSDVYKAKVLFAPDSPIYAGKWNGTVTFTVDFIKHTVGE